MRLITIFNLKFELKQIILRLYGHEVKNWIWYKKLKNIRDFKTTKQVWQLQKTFSKIV